MPAAASRSTRRRPTIVGDCTACDAPSSLRLVRAEPITVRYTAPEDLAPREEDAQHGYAECMNCGTEHEAIRPKGAEWGARFPGETSFDDRGWIAG